MVQITIKPMDCGDGCNFEVYLKNANNFTALSTFLFVDFLCMYCDYSNTMIQFNVRNSISGIYHECTCRVLVYLR